MFSRKIQLVFALFAVITITLLKAADPYLPMDMTGNGLMNGKGKFEPAAIPPSARILQPGQTGDVLWAARDLNANPDQPPVWGNFNPDRELKLVSAKDDYTCLLLDLFFPGPVARIKLTVSDLNGTGLIPADRVRLFQIPAQKKNPRFLSSPLLPPELTGFVAGDRLSLLVMVHVPAETAAGIYHGNIAISSPAGRTELPVTLRVMDFSLPLAGGFGFYLNGNLYRSETAAWAAASPGFTGENLDRYFKFYRSRRLNSVTLYDNLPDLHYVDGKVTGAFSDFSRIAAAMNRTGMTGPLILDLRDIGYWCNAVAEKLQTIGSQTPSGDVGVTMSQRKPQDTLYSEKTKEIYAQAVRHLVATARNEKWPPIRLLADEEIGNRTVRKTANYESFMPIIMKEFPELAAVVDNSIGYGKIDAVDYGKRDRVPFRQYNSWTDESLVSARDEKAEIWSYNYGATRLAFGFLQQRLGSQGHHQWADLWDAPKYQWQYTRLSDRGVVSTLDVERIHEGCIDYAACEYLKTLIVRQEQAGKRELADYGKRILSEVIFDFPIQGTTARRMGHVYTNEDMNARRWQVFLAIEKLSGQEKNEAITAGTPALRFTPRPWIDSAQEGDFRIELKFKNGRIEESGKMTELFWSKEYGPLRFLTDKENQLKAFASSDAEYRKLNQPSWTVFHLAALPDGLAIYALANHVQPIKGFRYQHADNDPQIWKDDCIEFFFGLPNGNRFQLLVNAAGAKTFIANRENIVPAAGIKSFLRYPINASGGTATKLLIPWSYFGLREVPASGSIWEFNAGREFHSGETNLSWAKLMRSFHEQEKWGRLVFNPNLAEKTNPIPKIWFEPLLNHLVISGFQLEAMVEIGNVGQTPVAVTGFLCHENGSEIKLGDSKAFSGLNRMILSTDGLSKGKWKLRLQLAAEERSRPEDEIDFTVLPSPWQ